MYQPMRKADRALTPAVSLQLLMKGEYGFLATVDREGQPYAVPLSYVLMDGAIYFHSALEGYKLDNLRHESRTHFTVVGETEPHLEGRANFTTSFESVMVFGRAFEVTDREERTKALLALCEKYVPGHSEMAGKVSAACVRSAVWKVSLDHVTGKAKRKL